MAGRKWTQEQRETALAIYREHGPRAAAERTAIPLSTIGTWARAAGLSFNPERTENANRAKALRWEERRRDLTDALGDAAAQLLTKALAADDGRAAQAFMTAAAIGVDKAQLLSGGVTTRHEVLDAEKRRERVRQLTDELDARRRAKDGAAPSEADTG